ncbi:MAG TPA: NAD(P)/FAD-dependent oxidoreductase [Methylomirabilota bacterium]|jgi:digeranylgeranylglycerophospholipid reductase
MPDLAIVGGGPAGLLTARRCAEAGLEVVVLEEHAEIGAPTHCTGIVSLATAALAKIPDDIILGRLQLARLVSPGGAACEVRWAASGSEEILVVDRAQFDRGLADQARRAGAVIRAGTRVDAIDVRAGDVRLDAGGEPLSARACVLACGVSYRLHRQLGFALSAQMVHTAQIEVDAEPTETVELYFGREVAPDGFLWAVPIRRGDRPGLKLGALARGDAGARLSRFLARPGVSARLRSAPGPMIRRLLPLEPAPQTAGDRVLLVGDAGGFTKPTTGGGIYYSLLTASLAADTLIEGFQAGRLDAEFLARYESRWEAELGADLRVSSWLRQFLTRCRDAEIDGLVRALASDSVQSVIHRTARFNRHRDVILALLREPGIAALLFKSLFR